MRIPYLAIGSKRAISNVLACPMSGVDPNDPGLSLSPRLRNFPQLFRTFSFQDLSLVFLTNFPDKRSAKALSSSAISISWSEPILLMTLLTDLPRRFSMGKMFWCRLFCGFWFVYDYYESLSETNKSYRNLKMILMLTQQGNTTLKKKHSCFYVVLHYNLVSGK